MVYIKASVLAAFIALTQVNGHFRLNSPATVGFNDDNEGKAPCGGFSVNFDNSTDFFVGGDAIALTSTHPAAIWLFRATLDETAAGNWTNLLPAVSQDSLGNFCEKNVVVPSDFAGKKGVIQVVQSATDGLLYQCAAVNFKSGANPDVPSDCKNVTGLSATFTTDPALSTIPGSSETASPSGSGSSTTSSAASTTTSSAAATSATKGSSASTVVGSALWGSVAALGSLIVAFGL